MADEKKITIKEFRMWLQGVEEMQDPAWVPNPTQWQRIREKINTIDDEQVVVSYPQPTGGQGVQQPFYPVPATGVPLGNELPGIPAGPSSLNLPRPPSMPVSPPPGGLFATPETPSMPVRTPNIDTTNGSYQSNFA